ncbi:CCA tRNA nucleotidyltransferase [Candidatus Pelagibacter sp.]|nr:CCA tRNA nucleotidyltransferase [Candidatus Pelagibacter sp.]
MKNFLNKFFLTSNNLNNFSKNIKDLSKKTPVSKIFDAINLYSSDSEIRYVGGCIRKLLNNEKVDDIDLATNLEPDKVCESLKKNNINYYKTGIKHGTITAIIDNYKFEITTLREDISTDGRHATVKFSKDWRNDASRRDFTINSIYSDKEGNLFDPFNGKNDLEKGIINFIGNVNDRIQEDYLRILRYLRFFLNYSKVKHNLEIIRKLKINIGGVSILSKERLLDELKKISKLDTLEKLSKDKHSLDLILLIFPELKNIKIFSNLDLNKKKFLEKVDFIFFLSLLIIDGSDNADYFLYKYNISKKDQKRIKIIDNFFKEKINLKTFTTNNINKLFYYNGKEAVIDILTFKMIKSKKFDQIIFDLIDHYRNKSMPIMPIGADVLMAKYKIPEGKLLGNKLKIIEQKWVNNDFKISDQEVKNIIQN